MKRLSLLVSALVLAGSAQALTTGSSFSNPNATTEINQTGTLSLFDSALGTLTDVVFMYGGNMVQSIRLTNNGSQLETVEAVGNVSMRFTSTNAALNGLISAAPARLPLSVTTGEQDLASGASVVFGPLNDVESRTFDSVLDSLFAAFQAPGGGTFDVGCRTLSGLALTGGGGNVGAEQSTTAGCNASITYTYTAAPTVVPEPASLALVGLALAAVGVTAARRRA